LLAAFLLGIGMTEAGWLGHDYAHGRGELCNHLNKIFGYTLLGFSRQWWSHKHNFHHAFPNRLEIDGDIHNEPIIHLFFPDKEKESAFRKY
jgi:fatty acid desaturase